LFVLDRRDPSRRTHGAQEEVADHSFGQLCNFDHGIYRNGLGCYGLGVPTPERDQPLDTEMTVDALASRTGLPVRTIREYQTEGLLPAPQRRGRVGIYGPSHLRRLELIGRLQGRGYSLAGIRDLVASWRDGADLGEVLGLEPDQLVELDEPGAAATLAQLAGLLPAVVPARLDALVATGVVEREGPDGFCVPSPSLLALAVSALAAGYEPDAVLALMATIRNATAAVADAAVRLLAEPSPDRDAEQLAALATRGRGLLAHGTGRLVVHTIGRRLGLERGEDLSAALRGLVLAES
jgi:DNA-binding transcriptional MerR regulator